MLTFIFHVQFPLREFSHNEFQWLKILYAFRSPNDWNFLFVGLICMLVSDLLMLVEHWLHCSLVYWFKSFYLLWGRAIKGDLIKCTSPPRCIRRGFITAVRSKFTEWKGRLSQQLFSRKYCATPKKKTRRLAWKRQTENRAIGNHCPPLLANC